MDQKRKYLVSGVKSCHIILKATGIDSAAPIPKHTNDRFPKTIKVHVNIDFQSFIRFRTGPVALEIPVFHQLRHSLRIINMLFAKKIPIIPFSGFFIINMIIFTEFLHFRFSKTKTVSNLSWLQHGKLSENINCGMLTILFNRKDSSHIGQIYIFTSFKKSPEEVQIAFLNILSVFGQAKYTIPFVNDKNKTFSCFCVDLLQDPRKSIESLLKAVAIFFPQFLNYHFLHFIYKNIQMRFGK